MKLLRLLIFSISFILAFNFCFCQDAANRKLLIGTWKFFSLTYQGRHLPDQKQDAIQDLETNKELILSFDEYGHFKVFRITADKKNDRFIAGKLLLTQNGKHLSIEGLTGDIILLNNEYLKLSQPDKSIMVFQRTEFLPK